MKFSINKSGSILIFSLWILMLLTIFAVHVGLRVRQRIDVIKRIEERNALHHAAYGGVQKAIALLRHDLGRSSSKESYSKAYKYNNPEILNNIHLAGAVTEVSYEENNVFQKEKIKYYGIVDEERKININFVDKSTLKRLIGIVTNLSEDQAVFLAEAIIDWREEASSKLEGFDSDSYYSNLAHPYVPKNNYFESVEELKLIYGMSDEIYGELSPYVTVYGNGQVNINTASYEVLRALGWDDNVITKFMEVRLGADHMTSTVDDFIFTKTFDIASELKHFMELKEEEVKQIDALNALGRIKTDSSVYSMTATAKLETGTQALKASCVYDSKFNAVLFYRENF